VRVVAVALGALLVAEIVGGCAGGGGASSFEGVPWTLSAGVDAEGWEAIAPSVRFEAGKLGGSTGCNRYGGPYTVDGDTLELGEIASTLIACPPPAGAVELAYLGAFRRAAQWRLQDEELVLLDVEDVELLRFRAATPAGAWLATGIRHRDAVDSPISSTEITATFAEDGSLSGSAGCNRYTSTYTTDRGVISVAPPATTRKLCPEPAGVMEQEAAYLAALAESARFDVGGGVLELLHSDGTRLVSFARSE
jgi:heat shock protein HslJ